MANDFTTDPNCVALYRFENGADTADSIGTNTLTSNGAPAADLADFKEGAACIDLERDTPDNYEITDANLDAGFPFKAGDTNRIFSWCEWIKMESLPVGAADWNFLWSKTDTGKACFDISVFGSGGILRIRKGDPGGATLEQIDYDTALSAGIWYHIGITYSDTDNSYRIRVWDANAGDFLDSDKTGTFANDGNAEDAIVRISSTVSGFAHDGRLDELVIFNDKLTTGEIDAIRSGTYTGPPTGGIAIIGSDF